MLISLFLCLVPQFARKNCFSDSLGTEIWSSSRDPRHIFFRKFTYLLFIIKIGVCALQTQFSSVVFRFELIFNPVHDHRMTDLWIMDQAGNADIRKFIIWCLPSIAEYFRLPEGLGPWKPREKDEAFYQKSMDSWWPLVFMFKQISFCLCLIRCFITLSVSEDVLIKVQGMLPGNMQFCSMQSEAMWTNSDRNSPVLLGSYYWFSGHFS